jgi:hypothetical protein
MEKERIPVMRKLFIFTIIMGLFATCTTKKDETIKGTVSTPASRQDSVTPKLPQVVKESALGALPNTISIKQLADTTVFSMYENKVGNYVDTFFTKGMFDADSPFPATTKGMVSMGAKHIKRKLKKEVAGALKSVRGRTFRHFFQSAGIDGGILFGISVGSNGPKSNEIAYFKLSNMAAYLARLERGEFGVFKKASWGGSISPKGSNKYSRKGTHYFTTSGSFILWTSDMALLKPGLVLSKRFYKRSSSSAFAFSFSNTDLIAKKVYRDIRYLFRPLHHIIIGYIKDIKMLSFFAHKPVNGEYLFTGFKKYKKTPKGIFAKGAIQQKNVLPLAKYLNKDAMGFFMDAVDKAIFKKGAAKYLRYFKRIKSKNRKAKYNKPLDFMLKQGSRLAKIVAAWSGQSAGSLRVVKNRYIFSGAIPLNKTAKTKDVFNPLIALIKDLRPKTLGKIMPGYSGRMFKTMAKFITIKIAKKKFGKAKGITFKVKIDWKKVPRRKYGISTQEIKIARFFMGNSFELSLTHKGSVIFVALTHKNSSKELKSVMKGKGTLPKSFSPPKDLSHSTIYGLNLADFFAKILTDSSKIKEVKSFSDLVKDLKMSVSYLNKYKKMSWCWFSMGTKNSVLTANLRFSKDAVRIPSVLAYTLFSASRHNLSIF